MLSLSMDYWNSRTIAATFKIGVSADIGFGVFNPDGTSDYAIISAVNDCNNTARAIMESSVDLWIFYTECGGSNPTQLIHIVYDLSQAVGSKFTYPERYFTGNTWSDMYVVSSSQATGKQLHIIAFNSYLSETCADGSSQFPSSILITIR